MALQPMTPRRPALLAIVSHARGWNGYPGSNSSGIPTTEVEFKKNFPVRSGIAIGNAIFKVQTSNTPLCLLRWGIWEKGPVENWIGCNTALNMRVIQSLGQQNIGGDLEIYTHCTGGSFSGFSRCCFSMPLHGCETKGHTAGFFPWSGAPVACGKQESRGQPWFACPVEGQANRSDQLVSSSSCTSAPGRSTGRFCIRFTEFSSTARVAHFSTRF